jgi:ParB-like chromosome segregation protein Spo0J
LIDFEGCFGYFSLMSNHIDEFPLSEIHETCAALRITNSRAQAAMVRSLATHGQLTPVVCIRRPKGLELVDGFKRLRSARLLLWPVIQVRLLERSGCAAKAEMIKLNRVSRSIHTIEEGRILHSLHRDDQLSLAQIATLMACSQKWVDRRLHLVESLHVEVLGHLDRGLISVDMARELAKIPYCLQEQALGLILEERLGSRELGKIARYLCAYLPVDSTVVLANLWEVIPPEVPCPAPSRKAWFHRLAELNASQHLLLAGAVEDTFAESTADEMLLRDTIHAGRELLHHLDLQLSDEEPF